MFWRIAFRWRCTSRFGSSRPCTHAPRECGVHSSLTVTEVDPPTKSSRKNIFEPVRRRRSAAEPIRRGEIHDFKLRQPGAKACLETGAVLERARDFNRAAVREPLGHPGRVAEEGEDAVDRGADVVDERAGNGSHPIGLHEVAPNIRDRGGPTVRTTIIPTP